MASFYSTPCSWGADKTFGAPPQLSNPAPQVTGAYETTKGAVDTGVGKAKEYVGGAQDTAAAAYQQAMDTVRAGDGWGVCGSVFGSAKGH